MYVTEVLSWQANSGVTDSQMINAIEGIVSDLKTLPGFLFETLAKGEKGEWQQVYFWRTQAQAHDSNQLMADKASMQQLMQLIKSDTLSMSVMVPVQDSGPFDLFA